MTELWDLLAWLGAVLPMVAITFGGGGGSSGSKQSGQTTSTARALEKEEKDLLKTQNEVLTVELDQIKRQNEALEAIYPEAKEILQGLTAATTKVVDVFSNALSALDVTDTERETRDVSEQEALKVLRGEAPVVTDDEQKLIDRIFETERQRGMREINRFAEEAAGRRNLNITDTPIASEALKATREFNEGLGAEKAKATLDVSRSGQQFREAVRQFQDSLRFQAQQNRLALTGASPFALSPPVSTITPAQAGQTVASTLAPLTGRPVSSTFSSKGSADFSQLNYGVNLLGSYSTARVKKDIEPLDREEFARADSRSGLPITAERDGYDVALDKLNATPIVRYRYKWEGDDTKRAPHFGPILELSPEEIRETPLTVNLLDYIGMNHAALKAIDRKVEALRRVSLPLDPDEPRSRRRGRVLEVAR